jgi:hypothetical protein
VYILGKMQKFALMYGHISSKLMKELIKRGLPATPDQYQRPPVDTLHGHQVPEQGDFG